MAKNGNKSVDATSYNVLYFSWTEKTQNVASNYTDISWKLEILTRNGGGRISSSHQKKWSVNINGTPYSGTANISVSAGGRTTLAIGETRIYHEADGMKTFNYSFSQEFNITFSGAHVGTIYGSSNGVLDTILRESAFGNVPTATLGSDVKIGITRHSSSYTHQLWYRTSEKDLWKSLGTGFTTECSFAVPKTEAKNIVNSTEGTLFLCMRTLSGSVQIGTDVYQNAKILVPSDIVPSISKVTVTDAESTIMTKFGAFVQNKSRPRIVTTAVGIYGSTIKSCIVEIEKNTLQGLDVTLAELSSNGTVGIKVTVTDSRGRKATKNTNISVLQYFVPTITTFIGIRSDQNGNQANDGKGLKANFSYKIAPLGNKNTSVYKIEYKQKDAPSWTLLASGSGYTVNSSHFKANILNVERAYNVRLTVSDYFGSSVFDGYVTSKVVAISIHPSGKGVGIGGYVDKQVFKCFMDAEFNRLAVTDVDYTMSSGFIKKWEEKHNSKNVLLENILNDFETDIKGLESKMKIELIPQSYVPFNGAWQVGEWQLIKIGRIIFMNFSIYAKVIADYLYQNITTSPIHQSIRPSKVTTLTGVCMNEANKNVGTSCMVIKENGTINLISEKAVGWHKFSGILIC